VITPPLSTASRIGLNLLILFGSVVALRLAESVFIPLVIAILLATLVWPAAYVLHQRLRLPWTISCFLVVGLLVLLNLAISAGFVLAVPKIVQDMPDLRTYPGQKAAYGIIRERLERVMPLDEVQFPQNPDESRVFTYIQQTLSEGKFVANVLLTIGRYSNSWLWHWVLVMFILLFLVLEGPMLSRRLVQIFGPSPEVQAKAVESLTDIAQAVRTYLVWRTIVNFFVGLVCGAVYHWVFHLSQPWTWGLLTAIACYVPYLGPIIAGIPPLVDAFVTQEPWYAVAVLVFYIAIITLEGYVLVPVVMGRTLELNATTVILACLFWDLVWGLPGLFLAMPLMAALKVVCLHVPGWRPWASLMSTAVEHERDLTKTKLIRTLKMDDAQGLKTGDGASARSSVAEPK
jgi:AI-2 transport protein TqsA